MSDEDVKRILETYRKIAVVGMSKNPEKDAHNIPMYLKKQGYEIIPVNPTTTEIAGMKSYNSLSDIPLEFDIVQLFRPSEDVPPFVDEALKTKAKVIWMQLGISNEDAAKKARDAGLVVVQNRCMMVEHMRLVRSGSKT